MLFGSLLDGASTVKIAFRKGDEMDFFDLSGDVAQFVGNFKPFSESIQIILIFIKFILFPGSFIGGIFNIFRCFKKRNIYKRIYPGFEKYDIKRYLANYVQTRCQRNEPPSHRYEPIDTFGRDTPVKAIEYFIGTVFYKEN